MRIEFYKFQGTGNDFICLDNRQHDFEGLDSLQVKKMCDRHFGIGADGLMLLNNKVDFDFEMIYYNADGQKGTMCGNGARCLVNFAYKMGIKKSAFSFAAVDGLHTAKIELDKNVSLKMQDVNEISFSTDHYILNTGSPHYVQYVQDAHALDVLSEGRKIRNSKEFAAEGINVNFVEKLSSYEIFVRTYERGVEAETLSCGTGVTAAALVSAHNDNGFNRVEIKTLGGKLSVEFEKHNDNSFNDIWLNGPGTFVFKGEIDI